MFHGSEAQKLERVEESNERVGFIELIAVVVGPNASP